MRSFSSEMESPPESVDYFAAGTTEKDQGSKVGQVADEHESLPQHLKRLFLYCSLFPSGYEFSKDELIQLWIAEGFIRERQNQRMEDTASEHFSSLEKEGFFVLSRGDFTSVLSAPTGNFLYKVNPIKHSILEDMISSGNYFRAVDGKLDGASEMTRHLSLICEDIDGRTFGILQNFKHLRTLHLLSCRGSSIKHVPRDFCFTLTFLRTLNLSGTLISELPSSVGNVKSLRYIDASHTPISRLPESIDSLHNLQTIKLRGCIHFVQLPKGMKKLSNLRHIDVDIIRQLDSMPAHLGNLSNLQTLPAFLVGRDDGCHVGELKKLNDLKGAFNISRLENVLSKEEAEEAALIDKKRIHSLELRWSNLFVENAEQQEKILECLQPHSGLKELQIQQYSGSILPTWISNPTFADLVVITLYRCRNCKLLPCMGQLPALKSLSIIEVNEVKEINHQFFRNGPVDHAFPKLERLEFDIMLNLKEWKDVQMGDLPSLVKLTMDSCPELVNIPPLSFLKSLEHLEFRRCPKLLSLPTVGLPFSLESFLVLDCLKLKEWCLNNEYWSLLCQLPSVWFDNEEGPCGITHQSALAHVTTEAAKAQSYTHISTEYSSSLSAAPATSLTQLPAFCKTMEPQEIPSKMPDSAVSIKKSSDISHLDQRSQPSSFVVYWPDVDESPKNSDNIGANDCDGKRLKTAARCRDENLEAKAEAETSSGKPLEQNTLLPDPPKQDYIHVQARMDQAADSHSFAERARREKIIGRMKIFKDLIPGYNKGWKLFGRGDGEGRGGGIDSIGIVCSNLGGRNDNDKCLSFHDIGKYAWGDFSMAVVQANQDLEDQGQIESGPFGTFVGIYDGHGGPEAAQYVCDNLFRHFQVSAEKEGVVTVETIQNAFRQTEEGFTALVSQLWSTKPKLATVGSCCLVGVICQGTLFVASLGDSRLVLGKKVGYTGEVAAIQLSTEHNAKLAEIRHELQKLHSHDPEIVVLKHGIWRVKGVIQISRSIGDVYMKHARFNREPIPARSRLPEPMNMPYMSANPTILVQSLHPDDYFLIFASDGLWEFVSNEKAVEIVNKHPHAGSARRLVKAALKEAARKREMRYSDIRKIDKGIRRHFHDDITVIVLFLNHDLISRGTAQKPPQSQ